MDKIPPKISFIIKEADMRPSSEINEAIRFLIKILRKEGEFKIFQNKITKLKKLPEKEKEEKIFLEHLRKEFIKQQKEYEERADQLNNTFAMDSYYTQKEKITRNI